MNQGEFIQIGKRKIGPRFKPIVIFELGINHNGNLKFAKKSLFPLKSLPTIINQ